MNHCTHPASRQGVGRRPVAGPPSLQTENCLTHPYRWGSRGTRMSGLTHRAAGTGIPPEGLVCLRAAALGARAGDSHPFAVEAHFEGTAV